MAIPRPDKKPLNPRFSSGPTAKRPGWSVDCLSTESLGRSHRAGYPKSRLKSVIDISKGMLGMPDDYLLAIVPASDTGAFEMAMWTMLGARGVDVLSWESFGAGWVTDIKSQLKLEDLREFSAPYGELPDLNAVDSEARDVVFTWNGTTSGVRVPNDHWIDSDREGLAICDATSAVFAMPLPWQKLDVVTWSWQKVMGGEAQHGMIVLSPKAIKRLENYSPPWPMPKIFRLTSGEKLIEGIFKGETINTPSMLCAEDSLDGLRWAETVGGLAALIERSNSNLEAIVDWVEKSDWIEFLAKDSATRSNTSVCLSIVDPWFLELDPKLQSMVPKRIENLLEAEGVAYDINGYRSAPPGLRLWAGATVERSDLEALFPWLDWAYLMIREEMTEG